MFGYWCIICSTLQILSCTFGKKKQCCTSAQKSCSHLRNVKHYVHESDFHIEKNLYIATFELRTYGLCRDTSLELVLCVKRKFGSVEEKRSEPVRTAHIVAIVRTLLTVHSERLIGLTFFMNAAFGDCFFPRSIFISLWRLLVSSMIRIALYHAGIIQPYDYPSGYSNLFLTHRPC